MHHEAAPFDVLLLSVVDERMAIAGGLDGFVTFLKTKSHFISLANQNTPWSVIRLMITFIPVVLLYIPAHRGPSFEALALELELADLELLSSLPSLFSRNMAVLYLSPCLDSLFSRKVQI